MCKCVELTPVRGRLVPVSVFCKVSPTHASSQLCEFFFSYSISQDKFVCSFISIVNIFAEAKLIYWDGKSTIVEKYICWSRRCALQKYFFVVNILIFSTVCVWNFCWHLVYTSHLIKLALWILCFFPISKVVFRTLKLMEFQN